MSIQPDVLYSRATMQAAYPDLDAAVARGEVCERNQWGIREYWLNSKPEQNARILPAVGKANDRKSLSVPVPVATPTQQRPAPVKKPGRPVEVGPLGF